MHVRAQTDALRDDRRMSSYTKSADQGCATAVWAATAHDLEGRSGLCCQDRIAVLLVRCWLSLMDTPSLGAGGFRGWT